MFDNIRRRVKKALSIEIARAKRFNYSIGVLLFEIIEGAPKGVHEQLPGTTIDVEFLRGQFRPYDTVENTDFRRYTVLLPQAEAADNAEVIKNRMEKLAQEQGWGEVNIGIAVFPDDGEDPKNLLKTAEMRLEESLDLNEET